MGNKKKSGIKLDLTQVIIIGMVLVFLFLVGSGRVNIGSIWGDQLPPPTTIQPAPTEIDDCGNIHVGNEFSKFFSASTINSFETACQVNGGIWTETRNELSCYWNPAVGSIDCDQSAVSAFSNFCEDNLKANWACDNSIAYVGCYCTGTTPADWDADEQDQNGDEQDPCNWYDVGITGMVECRGYCEDSYKTCYNPEGTDICECMTDEEIEYTYGQIGTIFVTDLVWNGASGGISGINNKCQTQAYYAGLDGNWIAIAGDTAMSARFRVNIDVPFYRIDGVKIADSHADLFDGSIQNPININQDGNLETGTAWTGSDGAGYYVSDNCHDWNWVAVSGYYGDISSTSSSWLHDDKTECSDGKHFYCVRIS